MPGLQSTSVWSVEGSEEVINRNNLRCNIIHVCLDVSNIQYVLIDRELLEVKKHRNVTLKYEMTSHL